MAEITITQQKSSFKKKLSTIKPKKMTLDIWAE